MITVLMPSRGRTAQAQAAYAAFEETKSLPDTKMMVILDWGEPGYADLPTTQVRNVTGGMAGALNAALDYASGDILVFVGDDHRFRTPGWDRIVADANAEIGGGILYGNDLLRGEDLASAVFMDARIVRALGWMALPGCKHLFLDDAWMTLGRALGRLRYLPDVIVEHMHPTAGKAAWDADYARVNAPELYQHDAAFFHTWVRDGLAGDVERVTAALA